MADTPKQMAAPYATFSAFLNFINKLRETGMPSRIDPSVFGNASGSISYSIIAALKSLKLIETDGTPKPSFTTFVNADDEKRKGLMAAILKEGYPTLWGGSMDLKTTTAGQFDEHLRNTYEVKGSTIDKAASFFISAAKFADLQISAHLKARKAVAASTSAKKSSKQRRAAEEEDPEGGGGAGGSGGGGEVQAAKPLEYQLIDLMKEPDIEDDIKTSIWSLVQYLMKRKAS